MTAIRQLANNMSIQQFARQRDLDWDSILSTLGDVKPNDRLSKAQCNLLLHTYFADSFTTRAASTATWTGAKETFKATPELGSRKGVHTGVAMHTMHQAFDSRTNVKRQVSFSGKAGQSQAPTTTKPNPFARRAALGTNLRLREADSTIIKVQQQPGDDQTIKQRSPLSDFPIADLLVDTGLKKIRAHQKVVDFSKLSNLRLHPSEQEYVKVSGGGVRLGHGSVIEGSDHIGGIQVPYVIDMQHPALQPLFKTARSIGADPDLNVWDKIETLQAMVHAVLVDGSYDGPEYVKMLSDMRRLGHNVSIGDYVEKHCGVCRENAILTHLLLQEAGIDSLYFYGKAKAHYPDGDLQEEDHAINLIKQDDKLWIVDSYNRNFNGRALKDVARGILNPGNLAPIAADSDVKVTIAAANYPQYWVKAKDLAGQ